MEQQATSIVERSDSIRFRLSLRFVAIATAVGIAFGAFNYWSTRDRLESGLEQQAQRLAGRLRIALPGPLWNYDAAQVDKLIEAEMADPAITGIVLQSGDKPLGGRVRDSEGRLVAPGQAKPDGTSTVARLEFDDNGKLSPVGTAELYLSRAALDRQLRADLLVVLLQVLVLDIVLVFALLANLEASVLRPLRRLRDALSAIAHGDADLTRRLDTGRRDEIGEVAHWFNVFVGQLHGVVKGIAGNARGLSVAADGLARGAGENAARSTEQRDNIAAMAGAVRELTAGINRVSAHSSGVRAISSRSGELAKEGAGAVSALVSDMQRISDSVNRSAETIDHLGEESQKITAIVGVIKDIADQTNLLALNAAIEAARAGEAGRGFAVVADEVRKLAERTSNSTGEISETVGVVQAGIREAVERMQRGVATVDAGLRAADAAGGTIASLEECSRQVVDAIDAIVNAIGEQNSASGEIAQRVEAVSTLASDASTAIQSEAQSAGQVNALAGDLHRLVGGFKL